MASLRKRPDAAATDAGAPEVAIGIETDAPPAPERDDATEALARQIGSLRDSETIQQQMQAMQAAKQRREAWLSSTPGANENRDALGAFHHAALESGLLDCSPAYFRFLEDQLAALKRPAEAATHLAEEMQQRAEQAPEPPPRPSRITHSAPVSRDVPSSGSGKRQSNGRVTLSPAEQEAARSSNISLEEYAKQKLKLAAMKASGEYGEDNRR